MPDKVWIIEGHYDHEGFTIVEVCPSEEVAQSVAAPLIERSKYRWGDDCPARLRHIKRYDQVEITEHEVLSLCAAACV